MDGDTLLPSKATPPPICKAEVSPEEDRAAKLGGDMTADFLIPAADFGRIHQTIYSIVKSEGGDPVRSCFIFSVFGAAILQRHYGIHATASAGIAAYRLGGEEVPLLAFGEEVCDELCCTENGFHAWVEAKGWLLDFMSPLFGHITDVPAKMLQKELSARADTLDALVAPGDFFIGRNSRMERSLLEQFGRTPANLDLLEIAKEWYRPPPGNMTEPLRIFDLTGAGKNVHLTGVSPNGAW